ncbi:MAG: sigma-70 family RNA polymerase sigma factor [Blastocatellia bacterium]
MPLRVSSWRENQLSQTSQHTASDEELIAQVGQGDICAFEILVSRFQKQALRAARRFTGDAQEAEDLAQEAFLKIFRQADQYKPQAASFKTWFFTILLNLCRNSAKKKRPEYFGSAPKEILNFNDPAQQLDHQEQQRSLARAILNLPENQRVAFILCHYENFSYAESAKAMNLSVKAIESLLVRAKRSLRQELEPLRKKN